MVWALRSLASFSTYRSRKPSSRSATVFPSGLPTFSMVRVRAGRGSAPSSLMASALALAAMMALSTDKLPPLPFSSQRPNRLKVWPPADAVKPDEGLCARSCHPDGKAGWCFLALKRCAAEVVQPVAGGRCGKLRHDLLADPLLGHHRVPVSAICLHSNVVRPPGNVVERRGFVNESRNESSTKSCGHGNLWHQRLAKSGST